MSYGIPTVYRSIQFRSRAEARWAAFFDEIGWTWEYEPLDLPGYIPDFLVRGKLLVEIKGGAVNAKQALDHVEALRPRFEMSETVWPYGPKPASTRKANDYYSLFWWADHYLHEYDPFQEGGGDLASHGPLLVFGAFPFAGQPDNECGAAHGILIGDASNFGDDGVCTTYFFPCRCGVGLSSEDGLWACQFCGHDTRRLDAALDVRTRWAKACNAVQYKSPFFANSRVNSPAPSKIEGAPNAA